MISHPQRKRRLDGARRERPVYFPKWDRRGSQVGNVERIGDERRETLAIRVVGEKKRAHDSLFER